VAAVVICAKGWLPFSHWANTFLTTLYILFLLTVQRSNVVVGGVYHYSSSSSNRIHRTRRNSWEKTLYRSRRGRRKINAQHRLLQLPLVKISYRHRSLSAGIAEAKEDWTLEGLSGLFPIQGESSVCAMKN
jgi:hypothetical protein